MTSMPRRWPAAAPFSAIRLRLIRRVEPFAGIRTNVQTQSLASEQFDSGPLGLEDLDSHPRSVRRGCAEHPPR